MYQIVKFQFPFADNLDKSRPRPCLVVSPAFGKYNQIVLAYITTDITDKLDTDILLDPSADYFSKTGLELSSLIKLHRLFTVVSSNLGDVIGELPDTFVPDIKEKLKKVFKLTT